MNATVERAASILYVPNVNDAARGSFGSYRIICLLYHGQIADLSFDGKKDYTYSYDMNISSVFSWASPVGIGIWMAGVGVFFWGLGKLRQKN